MTALDYAEITFIIFWGLCMLVPVFTKREKP